MRPFLLAILATSLAVPVRADDGKEALGLAVDAYVYGYPLVTMEYTRRVVTNVAAPKGAHAPMGQFANLRRYPDAKFRDVTAPNADTLYSSAFLDLAKEPYLLSLPDEADRYFLMPMLSGWTDVFSVPGKRTTGTKAQDYAITGPGWKGKLPAGFKELKSPTNMVWILGRTYCTGTVLDYLKVHALQDKYKLVPLSAHGKKGYVPPVGKVDPAVDGKTPVRDQVHALRGADYFALLAKLLKDNPPSKDDAPMVARLAKLGVVPGKPFDAGKLAAAVEAAPKLAQAKIMGHFKTAGKDVNGWTFTTQAGLYGTDYLQRALVAAIGLGANRPQDAVYPTSQADKDGKPLDGASKYTMTFPKGQLPPVDAFWSLTMYDGDYFFSANALNRYTLSSRSKLVANADGSTTLFIQHDSPGKDKEANWLPAPKGKFILMLRLYWPKEKPPSIIDGSWRIPPVVKAGVAAPDKAPDKSKTSLGDFEKIGEEALLYGYPMVVNYGTVYMFNIDKASGQYKGPFNTIHSESQVFTPKDTAVVTPNSDTPYSMLGMDLRSEPLVLSVPEVEKGRYYSVQIIDMYTCNIGYVGSRATGNKAGNYMVAGPSWKGEKPAGVEKVFRCETDFAFAVYRTQLFDAADIGNVKKIQAAYKAQPLSAFLKKPAPPAAPEVKWPKFDKKLAEADPFAYLGFVLSFCPTVGTAEVEKPLRERFARIGIVAGEPLDAAALSKEERDALGKGMKAGLAKIKARVAALGKELNGWRVGSAFGDRAFYKGDWTLRAAAAMAGIYGNDAVEALYPLLATDASGAKPDGAKGKYTLTFAEGQLPPVNAFWSVTMYDGKTQLLIENPINRYLINSPMLPGLKKNADGSLTLHIQKDSPGKDKESNWLPAPDGPIFLVMRLYWPKESALKGGWKPPALKKAE